ncbi:hypothetical protein, partial [Variovorax atrisoli]|uniref:hypothetical protein n=1 Tax=Variovorax atrisoli TaxID=3394203 RepID=UPI003392DA30
MKVVLNAGSGSRTQKEDKNYAKVAKGPEDKFWFFLCDFCVTFATSAFGCPYSESLERQRRHALGTVDDAVADARHLVED